MQVVIVEPKKNPMVQNIDGGLEAMQKIVGGTMQDVFTILWRGHSSSARPLLTVTISQV